MYDRELQETYGAEMRGLREFILKSRQLGFSTDIAARFFIDTVNTPNTQTVVIAQDQGSSERLFQMVRRFQNNLPPDKKLPTRYDTKNVLYWPTIDSYYFVGTAGSKKIGRGGTINNIHASEVFFWENPAEIIAGLMEAVPDSGNIILESTANGVGGVLYDEYWNAVAKRSPFNARFYPWFYEDRYRTDRLFHDEEFEISQEELKYIEKVKKYWNGYTLDTQQLKWRRNKAATLKKTWEQEYPVTPEEAFISSGSRFLTEDALKRIEEQLTESSAIDVPLRYPDLRRVAAENLRVYQRPLEGRCYVLGVDPSEGISEEGADHDYSPIQVFDYTTWEQVAVLDGRHEPHDLGMIAVDLARMYNNSLLVVERNNHGHSVLNTIINHCGYPTQQNNQVSGVYTHADYDARNPHRMTKPGWPQNPKTRMQACNALYSAIEDGTAIIRDRATWRQLNTFVKLPGGKIAGEAGTHDDLVIAMAIVMAVLPTTKPVRASAPKQQTQVISRYGSYR